MKTILRKLCTLLVEEQVSIKTGGRQAASSEGDGLG
jgi:hypothetical protein